MSTLPQETRDRIEADALTWSEQQHGHDEPNKDYLEGAATEAKRAQGPIATLALLRVWLYECKDHGKLLDINMAISSIETTLAKYQEVSNG